MHNRILIFAALMTASSWIHIAPAVTFAEAINNGQGGEFHLNGSQTYTGGILIQVDSIVYGNGATVQLGPSDYIRVAPGVVVEISNLIVQGGQGLALGFDGVNRARFTGTGLIVNPASTGSGLEAGGGLVRLINCIFNNGVFGINAYLGATLEQIEGCEFNNQSDTGVLLNASTALSIRNCRFSGIQRNAILAISSPQTSVASCTFENITNDTQAYCLSIQDSQNVTIGDGCLIQNSDKGVFLKNCSNVLVRNTVVANCRYLDGISLQDGTVATIENCEVSLCQSGIAIVNGSSGVIQNCYLHNNLKKQTTPILGQGMFILDASSAVVLDTTIANNDNEGIFAEHADFLHVEGCVIMDNGWGAQDGNGVFCDNTSGLILNNKIIHNFLKGIQARTRSVWIEGNEIRRNGRGGITLLNSPNNTHTVIENLVWANTASGTPTEELNLSGSGTQADAYNNFFSRSNQEGVLVQNGARLTAEANIVRNNAVYNINVFNGDVALDNNVLSGSQRSIYHNGSSFSRGNFNDVTGASVSGAEAINCGGCPFPYQNNWWGHASGPRSSSNPGGQGLFVGSTIAASPWLTAPVHWSAVFEGFSVPAQEWKLLNSSSLPFLLVWFYSSSALNDQYLAAQASFRDIIPHRDKPFAIPPDTIFLWIVTSMDVRVQVETTLIELSNTSGLFPDLANTSLFKYNKEQSRWLRVPDRFVQATQVHQFFPDEIQGSYLISPGGTLNTGTETYSNQFYLY